MQLLSLSYHWNIRMQFYIETSGKILKIKYLGLFVLVNVLNKYENVQDISQLFYCPSKKGKKLSFIIIILLHGCAFYN